MESALHVGNALKRGRMVHITFRSQFEGQAGHLPCVSVPPQSPEPSVQAQHGVRTENSALFLKINYRASSNPSLQLTVLKNPPVGSTQSWLSLGTRRSLYSNEKLS